MRHVGRVDLAPLSRPRCAPCSNSSGSFKPGRGRLAQERHDALGVGRQRELRVRVGVEHLPAARPTRRTMVKNVRPRCSCIAASALRSTALRTRPAVEHDVAAGQHGLDLGETRLLEAGLQLRHLHVHRAHAAQEGYVRGMPAASAASRARPQNGISSSMSSNPVEGFAAGLLAACGAGREAGAGRR